VIVGDGLDLPDEPELVGTLELSLMWQISRPYITNTVTKQPDFPKPALNLTRKTRRWLRVEVEAWRKKHAGR
jgi:predicted DNA-binding transcriptional regulator AlpA